jgi:D-3-phosphoglycerate dehydrogenase
MDIGDVVLDINSCNENPVGILEEIRALPNTLRTWLLNRV